MRPEERQLRILLLLMHMQEQTCQLDPHWQQGYRSFSQGHPKLCSPSVFLLPDSWSATDQQWLGTVLRLGTPRLAQGHRTTWSSSWISSMQGCSCASRGYATRVKTQAQFPATEESPLREGYNTEKKTISMSVHHELLYASDK